MKKLILCLLALPAFNSLSAQFSDSVHYYTGLNSSGSYNRTNNSNYYLFNNSLKLSAKKKSMSYNILNKWLYGKQDDQLTNNDYSSTLDINLYKTFPHFYYWGLGNYASSYSLKINSQLQAGLGVAYNVIDRKTAALNVSDGFIYDYSDIILTDSTHDRYGTIRNSFRLQIKCNLGTRFTLNGNGFYQPSLQVGNDYIIRSDVSLAVKIKKWLSISGGLTYNQMSRTRAENLLVTYGLVIENYY